MAGHGWPAALGASSPRRLPDARTRRVRARAAAGVTRIPFAKLHGAGNSYVALDGRGRELDLAALARAMTAHHTGVGSDGLVVAQEARVPGAAIRMRVINSDGSEAEMSGNGVRLFAKYLLDRGLASLGEDGGLVVETGAGPRTVYPRMEGGVMVSGRVAMGVPSLVPADLPMATDRMRWVAEPLALGDQELEVTCLSLGNPHAVHLTDQPVGEFPLRRLGSQVQQHRLFPNKVNFEVANILSRSRLRARVYERGEGETRSSGTGSTACAVAARLAGLIDTEVAIDLPGGTLHITWPGEGHPAWLDGPTTQILEAHWPS